MADNKQETEQQIFEAACRIFQQKGYAGARMQEIADEADINKSMLHYYYRSKDKLFQKVYQQQMSRFFPVVIEVLDAEIPLDEKVAQLVDAYYAFFEENPKLMPFVLHEMHQNPERFRKFIEESSIARLPDHHVKIEEEIEKGMIDDVNPKQLIISIVSLTLFPFLASPMIKAISNFDNDEFAQFMNERKAFLVDFILNGINYKKQ